MTQTPKEKLAEEILSAIRTFEEMTGAEVYAFRIKRFEEDNMQNRCEKTIPIKISFELK